MLRPTKSASAPMGRTGSWWKMAPSIRYSIRQQRNFHWRNDGHDGDMYNLEFILLTKLKRKQRRVWKTCFKMQTVTFYLFNFTIWLLWAKCSSSCVWTWCIWTSPTHYFIFTVCILNSIMSSRHHVSVIALVCGNMLVPLSLWHCSISLHFLTWIYFPHLGLCMSVM